MADKQYFKWITYVNHHAASLTFSLSISNCSFRAGMHADVVAMLIELAAPKIVYVSCNPATQARDLKLLVEGGYQVDRARPVDMFPQTPHCESVAVLSRA